MEEPPVKKAKTDDIEVSFLRTFSNSSTTNKLCVNIMQNVGLCICFTWLLCIFIDIPSAKVWKSRYFTFSM